jgi:hypothetical protein
VFRLMTAMLVGFFLLRAAIASAAPSSAVSRKCDASLLPDCNALSIAPLDARGQLGFGTPRDGGAIFNGAGYWDARDSKNPKVVKALADAQTALMLSSPAHEARARQIADSLRKKAVDFLKAHTPESPERATLIARLNSIAIDTTTNPPDTCGEEQVPRGFPNLGYSKHRNTLYICTPATNVTEPQLVAGLAHELGHVISPCAMSLKVYTVDKEQLYKGPLAECSSSFFYDENGDPGAVDPDVNMLMMYQPPAIIEHDLNPTFAKLKDCKVISASPQLSLTASNTFSETRACLLKKFQSLLEQSDAFHLARSRGLTPTQASAQMKASGDDICAADVEESFADSFGASLLGQVATDKGWSEKDVQLAALDKTAFSCYESSHGRIQNFQYELGSARIRTLLGDSQTSAIMRCEIPKNANLCPLKFSSATSEDPLAALKPQRPGSPARSRK